MDWSVLGNSRVSDDGNGVTPVTVDTGSANTKTAWVQQIASLAYSTSGFLLYVQNSPSEYQLIDIGIGGAGSEVVVLPNFRVSQALSGTHSNFTCFIPLALPAGTRVAIRSQGSAGSKFCRIKLQPMGDAWAGLIAPVRWEDWGANTTNSQGTSYTTGNGSKGSWVQLIAATAFTSKWMYVHIVGNTAPVDISTDIGIGGAGSEVVIIPDLHYTVENLAVTYGPFPYSVPAGSRIAVRGQGNGGTCTAHAHGGA